MITNPVKLSIDYFPLNFHWIPKNTSKDLKYYSAILLHEKSIFIKPINDKYDKSIIIYHSIFILNITTEEKWGLRPTAIKPLPGLNIPYSVHDYIQAWFKFMLHQDATMTHSRFINFDKNFCSQLSIWFICWWTQFGPITDIFPRPLTGSFKYFTSIYKTDAHGAKFLTTLHFVFCFFFFFFFLRNNYLTFC